MALSTLAGVRAHLLPDVVFSKVSVPGGNTAFTLAHVHYSTLGGSTPIWPDPAAGMAGEALVGPYAAAVPFPAPVAGANIYLAGLDLLPEAGMTGFGLYDRLWQNSGVTNAVNTEQAVNSVAFPPRDADGSSNGRGISIAVEYLSGAVTGSTTFSMNYTNSDGVAGRTSGPALLTASPTKSAIYFLGLQAGDVGVRSIQGVTYTGATSTGVFSLVAYRRILNPVGTPPADIANVNAPGVPTSRDAIALGLPRWYDNSVPFMIYRPGGAVGRDMFANIRWAQG